MLCLFFFYHELSASNTVMVFTTFYIITISHDEGAGKANEIRPMKFTFPQIYILKIANKKAEVVTPLLLFMELV